MSRPTGKEFRVSTLLDFVAIPADRIGACLIDFQTWVGIMRRVRESGTTSVLPVESFLWIDDGKRDITVRILDGTTPPEGQP